jgi:hypothetical protein
MFFLFQRIQVTKSCYGRSFVNVKDFTASPGRQGKRRLSIVPSQRPEDRGGYLPMDELGRIGREAARAAGIDAPNQAQIYEHALLELARQGKNRVDDEDVPRLIRNSLFDSPFETAIDEDFLQLVYDRVGDAFLKHTEGSAEAFNKWYLGPKNSFVRQIAQGKRKEGGDLDRDRVNHALLELGWRAYPYIAGCISHQMQAVRESMPEPLSPIERRIFAEMHLPQPHFGGLPLILLGGRIGFARIALRAICDHPGERGPVEAFHRLLQTYAMMIGERRESDRERKRPRGAPLHQECKEAGPAPSTFSMIAARILDREDTRCRCELPDWRAELDDGEGGDMISLDAHCNRCGERRKSRISRHFFAEMAKELFESVRSGTA